MSTTTGKSAVNGKFIFALILAITLACGLCPGFAHAAQLGAGQADLSAQASATGQSSSLKAATKTVYVVVSSTNTADWGIVSKVSSTFTYNKYGLLKKRASTSNMDGAATTTYAYNGTELKSATQKGDCPTSKSTYTYNKKGQIKKEVEVIDQPTGGQLTCTHTATYGSGKIKKIVHKEVLSSDGQNDASSYTTAYTYNKKGQIATRTAYGTKTAYAYDAQGNYKNIGGSKYTNKYNAKKLLAKRSMSEEGFTQAVTFKYKAITVKASVADKVAAQQWAIVNDNLNFALGLDV